MKYFLIIAFLIITFQLHAQINCRDSIVGTWIYTDVSYLESKEFDAPAMRTQFEEQKKYFLNSNFIFNVNGIFELEFPKNTKGLFAKNLAFLNNKKWFFYRDKKRISVGTQQENLMHIDLKEDQNIVYFLLYETPLLLKMRRM